MLKGAAFWGVTLVKDTAQKMKFSNKDLLSFLGAALILIWVRNGAALIWGLALIRGNIVSPRKNQ